MNMFIFIELINELNDDFMEIFWEVVMDCFFSVRYWSWLCVCVCVYGGFGGNKCVFFFGL